MAFDNTVDIGLPWAQDFRIEGTEPGDVFRVAFCRSAEGAELSVPVPDAARANAALSALVAEGIEVGDFRMGQPSLDEVFFALTGGPGREIRP